MTSFKGKGQGSERAVAGYSEGRWTDRADQFMSLSEAKAHRDDRVLQLSRLRQDALDMTKDFRRLYPDGPVYMAKAPHNARTFLRWRWTRADGQGRRTDLSQPELTGYLSRLDAVVLADLARYEHYRCHFNYHIATTSYALERLNDYIRDLSFSRTLQQRARSIVRRRRAD